MHGARLADRDQDCRAAEMTKRLLWFVAFCLGLGIALPAHAQSNCVLPEILQNGSVADANQVMNNFNTVIGCINNQNTGIRLTPQTTGAVGDGAADDTAAVQAAINAAAAAGDTPAAASNHSS